MNRKPGYFLLWVIVAVMLVPRGGSCTNSGDCGDGFVGVSGAVLATLFYVLEYKDKGLGEQESAELRYRANQLGNEIHHTEAYVNLERAVDGVVIPLADHFGVILANAPDYLPEQGQVDHARAIFGDTLRANLEDLLDGREHEVALSVLGPLETVSLEQMLQMRYALMLMVRLLEFRRDFTADFVRRVPIDRSLNAATREERESSRQVAEASLIEAHGGPITRLSGSGRTEVMDRVDALYDRIEAWEVSGGGNLYRNFRIHLGDLFEFFFELNIDPPSILRDYVNVLEQLVSKVD